MRHVVFCMFLAACGGSAQSTVTIAATPTATTNAEPTSSSLPQNTNAPPTSSTRPRGIPGTKIRFQGGDGSSLEQAIAIVGAQGEGDGTAAEYKYLEMLYGPRGRGHDVQGQALLNKNGRSYDKLDVQVGTKSIEVYFDISDYFGKF